MKTSLVVFSAAALLAPAVTAQTSTACAADYIVEACLSTEQALFDSCASTDYGCKCNAYVQMVTCFNNCPNDSRVFTYQGQEQIWCAEASQFPSTTTATATTGTGAATAVATTTAASSSSSGSSAKTSTGGTGRVGVAGSGTATASVASATSTATNSAAELARNAGGVLVAVAGAVAVLL